MTFAGFFVVLTVVCFPSVLRNSQTYEISRFGLNAIFEKYNIQNNNTAENRLIFPCGNEGAMRRRILLGDNRGGEAVTLQPIRFQCVIFCISTLLFYICMYVCIYIYIYIYI